MYTRSRATPTNPNTPAQQDVKAKLSNLAQVWSNVLTSAQRLGWEAYAAAVPVRDTLGEERPISGNAMFVRCNMARVVAGLNYIATPPTTMTMAGLSPPTIITATASTSILSIGFTNTDLWASTVNGQLFVFVSQPQSQGINFFKGPFRYAGRISGAASAPTSPQAITSPFPFTAGNKLFVRFVASNADARLSADLIRNQIAI